MPNDPHADLRRALEDMAIELHKLRVANAALTAENTELRDEIAAREALIRQRDVTIGQLRLDAVDQWQERREQESRINTLTTQCSYLWGLLDTLRQ